ncbi:50S ribosomal protein L18 [Desulfatibacillum aliphaticivorans]|uniref:Large ribosomal subunit protein uL18 n=1 Tax=Desulfatibacillum aliphaticivorans TaxID=218208 RepID=RL18_DESAL|nr:50S ribosomal protein L18 [Desulfatibacillum aliphaticivorans]B8FER9.1 RecName: Full=Large ribosomal subunit protein uL18; AltName: Full=50S ribosomal protein L18 [Desulfatibacillum aliphaticivorans]ACL03596.1 ribosomal protein L18 [Desulfatibacillum aliphaticivorans]
MAKPSKKNRTHEKRKVRVRKKLFGTQDRPRLSVFRSAKHIYAQVIIDETGQTIAGASTLDKEAKDKGGFESKVEAAKFVGKLVAQRAKEKGVTKVVFDRNGFLYHGRVKAVSTGARDGGLEF